MTDQWTIKVELTNGARRYSTKPPETKVDGIDAARAMLEEEPEKYAGFYYQNENSDEATLIERGHGYEAVCAEGGWMSYESIQYTRFGPSDFTDEFTDSLPGMNQYQGQELAYYRIGRGEGCCDFGPGLTLMNEVDPNDIGQGGVGDCWMMSAIACIAEFPGTISEIFQGATELNEEGRYTVRLFDVPSKVFVEVTVDDRLACASNPGTLLSARESPDLELWCPILEKALCAHAGGWDHISGGQVPFGWALLTGCMDSMTIKLEEDGWQPYNVNWDLYASNSPHSGDHTIRGCNWPDGSGGQKGNEEMFALLAEWDASNFLLAASTCSGSDTEDHDGIVDGHAYSVISVEQNVCDKFNMILFRNPWGRGEFRGQWADGGDMWDEHPDVQEALEYEEVEDDGQFWMDFDTAVTYFQSFQVMTKNMCQDAPPDVPVKKRHLPKKERPHKVSRAKPISIGYMEGTWRHSKTDAEIEVQVNTESNEVTIIREGMADKIYTTHQFITEGRVMFYGLIGKAEIEMNEEGAACDYVQWNNGVKWRRVLKPVGFCGKWLHSGGQVIAITIEDDVVDIEHPISGTVSIDLSDFVVNNVVRYKGYKGLPDDQWKVISFNNGVTWTRQFGIPDLVGKWQHSRTNGMITITCEPDESDYGSGTVSIEARGAVKEYTFEEFHNDGQLHYFGVLGEPNQQLNAIAWSNRVVWSRIGNA